MSKLFTIKEFVGHIPFSGGEVETRDVVIPEHWWVLQVGTHFHEEVTRGNLEWEDDEVECQESGYKVVGWQQIDRHVLNRVQSDRRWNNGHSRSRSAMYLLAADEPFGVIREEREDGKLVDGQYFVCARQIHKGELGRRPQIARPKFVREAADHFMGTENRDGQPIAPRNLRRGKKGWARLSEVAKLVGMIPEELIWRYLAFTDCEGPELQVIFGGREKIAGQKLQPGQITRFNEEQLPALFYHDPTEIWIRQGFALTILYLKHFGYEPVLPEEKAAAIALIG